MNLLYVSLDPREKRLGWIWFGCYLTIIPLLFGLWNGPLSLFVKTAVNGTAVVLIFRSFLRQSLGVPLTTPAHILLKALLGLILSYVVTIVMNDLFYFYFSGFFAYTDFGPMYYNVNEAAFAALVQENFWLTAIAFVVLMPVVEEVLFRGLLFGTILRRSRWLAYLVSVAVFAFVPAAGLLGSCPTAYIVMNFLQYVPLGLILDWVYTSTETIVTPIVLRMAIHTIAICSMR